MITGGMLVLTLGSANVFAASPTGTSANAATHSPATANVPSSSSKPHEHENVECTPSTVQAGGACMLTFTDAITKDEPFKPSKVCFSVSKTAGTVSTTTGTCTHEKKVGTNGIATGTFTSSATFCNMVATIYAIEPAENSQKHHTSILVSCNTGTNTSAYIPAGGSSPPAVGWLLGAIGLGAALVAVFALRIRRWFAPRRLAAR